MPQRILRSIEGQPTMFPECGQGLRGTDPAQGANQILLIRKVYAEVQQRQLSIGDLTAAELDRKLAATATGSFQ